MTVVPNKTPKDIRPTPNTNFSHNYYGEGSYTKSYLKWSRFLWEVLAQAYDNDSTFL
jgi:hypothetical protein